MKVLHDANVCPSSVGALNSAGIREDAMFELKRRSERLDVSRRNSDCVCVWNRGAMGRLDSAAVEIDRNDVEHAREMARGGRL